MSWITPKTNWVETDYFNPEDADRIYQDLSYLMSMAREIYDLSIYSTNVTVLFPNAYSYDIHYYSQFTAYFSLSYFLDRPNDLLHSFSYNINALTNLLIISDSPTKEYISNYPVDYYQKRTPEYYYTGWAVINSKYSAYTYGNIFPFTDYSYFTPKVRCPYTWNVTNSSGKSVLTVSYSSSPSPLDNQPFYNYVELNQIEQNLVTVYERFNQYLGG